jgi:uroporphyrinogen-III synthase
MRDDAPLVLLLRSRDEGGDEDRYERALRERGFRATCRPVLRFAFAGDDDFGGDDAGAALRHPDRWAGLVLTSPRAAQALEEMLRWLPDQVAAWEAKPAFAVGPKTAAELRAGGLAPTGEESGDAEALGSVIAKNVRSNEEAAAERPLLFLCGNRRREALPNRLRAEEVPFEERVVYETHLRTGPWLTSDGSDEAFPEWAVFFSPSGVEAVQQSNEAGWAAVRTAALGSTTAAALREAGWPPAAVAQVPSPDALAEALAKGD